MSKPVNTSIFGFSALQDATAPEGDAVVVWHKIMPAGKFQGRDGRGPFDAGDKTAMQAIVDRSRAYYTGSDIMVDYDHQALAAGPGKIGQAPASGWFKDFQVRDDGIYGAIEWTAPAAARIKAKEYRYLSPLFTTAGDKVSRIDNVALVNQSNLPLDAVAMAADRFSTQKEPDMKELLAKLAKALGLNDGASEEAVIAAIEAFSADRGKVAVAAGIKADATTEEVLVAMATIKVTGADLDPTKFVPMSMFKDVETRLNAFTAGNAEEKASDAVEKAMAAGKITPANKEWAVAFAKRDLADFEAFVGNQPVLTQRQLTPVTPQDGKPALSDEDRVAMSALGLTEDQFIAGRKLETA